MADRAPVVSSARRSVSTSSRQSSGLTSTSKGSAPAMRMADSVAGKVNAGRITRPTTPRAIKGAASAAVPLDVVTHTVSGPAQASASVRSRRRDSGPKFVNRCSR